MCRTVMIKNCNGGDEGHVADLNRCERGRGGIGPIFKWDFEQRKLDDVASFRSLH